MNKNAVLLYIYILRYLSKKCVCVDYPVALASGVIFQRILVERAVEWPALSVLATAGILVGYTMKDIRYKWNSGEKSVGISKEVELPQFRVLGHRQRQTVIELTTGNRHVGVTTVDDLGWLLIEDFPEDLISWRTFVLDQFIRFSV